MSKEEQPMLTQLEQFRNDLYAWFPHRADTLMDLLDVLSSNTTARSVVELSLNPLFRREYSSLHDGIAHLFVPSTTRTCLPERQEWEQTLIRLLVPYLPTPQRAFRLLGTDVTSAARPFARTLSDRMYVYQPNTVKGVKPVTIGHQYSVLAVLPDKVQTDTPPWVIPLLVNRVTSKETKRAVGLSQVTRLLEDPTLPFHQEFCVNVVDSDYSAIRYLGGVASQPNLVTIARLPGNRTVYRQASSPPAGTPPHRGHPTWFGAPISLKAPATWGAPDEVALTTFTTRKGQTYTVHLEGWYDRLRRGKRDLPMHHHPFTLVRARVLNAQDQMVFARPLWLVVVGHRRRELSLLDIWWAYRQRYDLEHFFRFGKQRLLMDTYQTPETLNEENWWTLVQLAYLHLWMARNHAKALPRPWERYLPRFQTGNQGSGPASSRHRSTPPVTPSPSDVQRDLARIIRQIGTPARIPKPRGKSPGRSPGHGPSKRPRLAVIKKSAQTS
jgi:hypothetical protein